LAIWDERGWRQPTKHPPLLATELADLSPERLDAASLACLKVLQKLAEDEAE
jgi:hypothetical protein